MKKEKILIVEDEIGIRNLIQLYLQEKNYEVEGVGTGMECLDFIKSEEPDLILLDIEMPYMNGFEVCKEIRKFSSIPILFVSCKKDPEDRIEGIQIGADDYITKPFDFHELEARIEAIFRRNNWLKSEQMESTILKYEDIHIDLDKFQIFVRGKEVVLSNKEFQLLALMAKEPNRIWPAEQLYDQIWGYYSDGSPQTVKVHISNLRRKVELNPSEPKYIQTARGFGYRFAI